MAAGLGFKTFATGEVLSAANVNGYLMQGVLVFADATARNAAITSPQEGQFAYLKDTNVTTYYTGSAWTNLDTTGMTNPMTTTGDTIYSSSGSTPARLGIGSTGNVLTVAGGVPSWASPAGSALNWSLLSTTSMSGSSSINFSGLTLNNYFIWVQDFTGSSAGQDVRIRFNNSSTAADYDGYYLYPSIFQAASYRGLTSGFDVGNIDATGAGFAIVTSAQSSGQKQIESVFARTNGGTQYQSVNGFYNPSTVVSSIQVVTTAGTFTAGTIFLYGAA